MNATIQRTPVAITPKIDADQYPEPRIGSSRPVVVLGHGGSGTWLLSRLIASYIKGPWEDCPADLRIPDGGTHYHLSYPTGLPPKIVPWQIFVESHQIVYVSRSPLFRIHSNWRRGHYGNLNADHCAKVIASCNKVLCGIEQQYFRHVWPLDFIEIKALQGPVPFGTLWRKELGRMFGANPGWKLPRNINIFNANAASGAREERHPEFLRLRKLLFF